MMYEINILLEVGTAVVVTRSGCDTCATWQGGRRRGRELDDVTLSYRGAEVRCNEQDS